VGIEPWLPLAFCLNFFLSLISVRPNAFLSFSAELILIDRDPRSGSILAQSHGRIDALRVAVTTLLCYAFIVARYLLSDVLLALLVIVSTVSYGYNIWLLPRYNMEANFHTSGLIAVFFLASFCAILSKSRGVPEVCILPCLY
jgi:hypothetical protein